MKKILITGSNGQVAYELIQLLHQKNTAFLALSKKELDITQGVAVNEAIKHFKPNAVINTAAYTYVDLAEKESSLAYAVNSLGPKNLAIACAKYSCQLVHISTDYVFDGQQTQPYVENDPTHPLNVYGTTKRQGELAVQTYNDQAMILRVSGIFGIHGNNFVKTILRLGNEKELLRIITDQTICPTPANAIAETLLQMLANPQPGIYHYCGAEATNWHTFATLIVQKALALNQSLLVKNIEAISTADYSAIAQRPRYSVLNCQKIFETFGIIPPDWQQGLTHVISQLSTS